MVLLGRNLVNVTVLLKSAIAGEIWTENSVEKCMKVDCRCNDRRNLTSQIIQPVEKYRRNFNMSD